MEINCAYAVWYKCCGAKDAGDDTCWQHTTRVTTCNEKQFKRQFRPNCKHFVSVVNSSLETRNSLKSAAHSAGGGGVDGT